MPTLRETQLIQLDIAKEIKRLCEKHNISYWLDSGSLLGAIRHGGFIPWDDDLDIGFLRDDYEHFIEVAKTELDDRYVLQTWETDKFYPNPFAKIRKKDTIYIEATSGQKQKYKGIFVDCFPYDVMPNSEKEKRQLGGKITFYKSMLKMKAGSKPWKNLRGKSNIMHFCESNIKYVPIRLLAKFCSKNNLIQKYTYWAKKYDDSKNFQYYYPQGATRFGKWVLPRICLEKTEKRAFEDTEFLCPVEYDLYLSLMYGDYMKLPPENERGDWHKIIKVEIK